jgi:hypothetical protein
LARRRIFSETSAARKEKMFELEDLPLQKSNPQGWGTRDDLLHLVRETADGGSASGNASDGDGCESSGRRWARQAKH